ncbi:uncharacterized protein MONBRDRAFT_4813 [Monosiga brevicollis MX1]|uniref:Cytochrome b5 heme-binding domain-containing protein n=1 Tax=Monosiga brevicollis TaxID=81824 RepID=A9UP06_MONBE|nr:uncharacterized protein MONBRDRAFT_4813 [Monosiga brevicollis MX1]EDQ92336.1 predicted protein [Monosiga brevicollis MX1]|eukprot:XP_001742098.1 hypothetical protein [Monosiga brevicollis MX1]
MGEAPPPPPPRWASRGMGVVLVAVVLAALVGWTSEHPQVQLALMRFFRDVSRAKAHARLYGRDNALAVMLGQEELAASTWSEVPDTSFNEEDLQWLNGAESRPVYLALAGRVYDVTAGRHKYGPGGSYHKLAGRDASRPLALGCLTESCLTGSLQVAAAVEASLAADAFAEKTAARLRHEYKQQRQQRGGTGALVAIIQETQRDAVKLYRRQRLDDVVTIIEALFLLLDEQMSLGGLDSAPLPLEMDAGRLILAWWAVCICHEQDREADQAIWQTNFKVRRCS